MKKLLIAAIAVSTLAITACTKKAEAAQDVYGSVAYGYQWMPSHDKSKQQDELYGGNQSDHGYVQAAVGTKLKNNVGVQLEYSQIKPSASHKEYEGSVRGKQETTSITFNAPIWSPTPSVTTYGLAGIGYTQFKVAGLGKEESAVGILGAGAEWQANKTVGVFSEVRAQYVDKGEYWQPQALVGVRVNLNQVAKNVTGASYR